METRLSAPATDPLHAHLGFWLRLVSNQVSGRFRQLLEEQGSSVSEWVALSALSRQSGTTHADLIRALGMTKGAASKIVSRLEAQGLARRQQASDGSRTQVLSLTPRGRALVPRLAALADQNVAGGHFLSAITLHSETAAG